MRSSFIVVYDRWEAGYGGRTVLARPINVHLVVLEGPLFDHRVFDWWWGLFRLVSKNVLLCLDCIERASFDLCSLACVIWEGSCDFFAVHKKCWSFLWLWNFLIIASLGSFLILNRSTNIEWLLICDIVGHCISCSLPILICQSLKVGPISDHCSLKCLSSEMRSCWRFWGLIVFHKFTEIRWLSLIS